MTIIDTHLKPRTLAAKAHDKALAAMFAAAARPGRGGITESVRDRVFDNSVGGLWDLGMPAFR